MFEIILLLLVIPGIDNERSCSAIKGRAVSLLIALLFCVALVAAESYEKPKGEELLL